MMKGKFSLNKLLHNNKLMIVFSLVAAVAIWASVVYDGNNQDSRTMTLSVPLDLAGSYAETDGLEIYEGATQTVKVEIRGPRSLIFKLQENDMRVTADYSEIRGAGNWPVKLDVVKNSDTTGYEITSVTPQSVQVYCDHTLTSSALKVEADISGITVSESSGLQLGTPVIEAPGLEDGSVYIKGPKTVVSKIVSVKARVQKTKEIAEVTSFDAELVALDADGNEVDTKYCEYTGLSENVVKVTVPVVVHRVVEFSCLYKNMPKAFENVDSFRTITPSSIEVVGTPEQVEAFASSIENLGTFDFHHLSLMDRTKIIPLNVPSGIRVLDGTTEVTVSFDMDGFSQKTLDLTLESGNTRVENVPAGRSAQVSRQKIENIRLVGPAETLAKITEADLSVVADMTDNEATGAVSLKVTVNVNGYDDVWVYYGAAETDGYEIFVQIQ